jgi:tetratricopeptide (TPR) repeat protein
LRPCLNRIVAAILAAALAATLPATVRADKIRTHKGIGYSGKITGLGTDGIIIEVAGAPRTVPLADIAKVETDAFPDLGRAEDAYAEGLGGKPQGFADAERSYRSMLGASRAPQWLRILIQARLYKLYADSGRTVEALDAYLELARGSPKLVAGLKLPAPAEDAHDDNRRMLKKVDDAVRLAAGKPYAAELQNFRVSLLMLEGNPEDVLPLLEPMLASQDERVRQSAMLKQIELLVAAGQMDEASAKLEAAAQALSAEHPDDVAYWRGRILKERGQDEEAALEFMRLPILYPAKDKGRTAEALWYAGQALEALKAPKEEIRKVYSEAATRYAGTPAAERAKRELVRLGN